MRRNRFALLIFLGSLLAPIVVQAAPQATLTASAARRWAADDAAIARGALQRSWTWGPQIFRAADEQYAEAPNELRSVWYFDKARMEITNPAADPQSPWYVTSGLLVRELISGQLQTGDTRSEPLAPADIPIAGDIDVPPDQAITFRDLESLASLNNDRRAPARLADEAIVTEVISKTGLVAQDARFLNYEIMVRGYDDITGHNLPDVWLQALPADQLLYIAGRPLTEPYWAVLRVGGEPRDVLMQAFERRVLTYTPDNDPAWRVEWGNVGRQYARWRYSIAENGPPLDPATALDPAPSIRPLAELSPEAARIIRDRKGTIAAAVLDLQSGQMWSSRGATLHEMFSTVKVPIMLGVLNSVQRENRAIANWEDQAMRAMIERSSNTAASRLLQSIGGAPALERYLRSIGLNNTQIDRNMWGYSTTTTQEMTRLLAQLADCTILNNELCAYALRRMQSVVAGQAWGVSAGAAGNVALKNGWSPEDGGWTINSIGYINDAKRYTIAIYTRGNSSKNYGIATIEQLSRAMYAALPE